MIQLQDIHIHTNTNVFYKLHLLGKNSLDKFTTNVSTYHLGFTNGLMSIRFSNDSFTNAEDAFKNALQWVKKDSEQRCCTINRINNPCDCEFLSQQAQQNVVNCENLNLEVQVNQ